MNVGWGIRVSALVAAWWLVGAGEAGAQTQAQRQTRLQTQPATQKTRAIVVEGTAGWAGFVDDDTVHHRVLGLGARVPIGRRLSIGPEVVYMIGPRDDRDLFVLGTLWVDLGGSSETARVVPYVVAGGGYMQHSDRFARGTFRSGEGSFTAGLGGRVHLSDRVYAGADVRIGWELHLRTTAHLGLAWPVR